MGRSVTTWLSISVLAAACGGTPSEAPDRPTAPGSEEAALCPDSAPAPNPLPGVTAAHLTPEYWLERVGDLDATLMSPTEIAAHNRALTTDRENGLPTDRGSLAAAPETERLTREVETRIAYMREKIDSGEYVDSAGNRLAPEAAGVFAPSAITPSAELRVALAPLSLRCGPRVQGLYKRPIDPAFDRNACSTIRPQEPVQVLMRWPNGMWLARTRYALGWLPGDAALSPAITGPERDALVGGPPVRARAGAQLTSPDGARVELTHEALLATDPTQGSALFADTAGVHRASAAPFDATTRPLTRRAVIAEAFARLGQPYGWGGYEGGVDCSRFLMDVLGTFGLELPRHSARQAGSGTYSIDVSERPDLEERARLIDAAAQQGIVLLHFPGHIMLYLGRDAAGTPMAIHSFSEYLEPCASGGEGDETLRRVDRVTVSDLTLGEGTSRRSFLERLERIVILGQRVGPGLIGTVTARAATPVQLPPANQCDDSLDVRVFHSPERPNPSQPLRVFVTSTRELGPVELVLVDPHGRRHTPEVIRLGGPPFTYTAQLPHPEDGRWTVGLGDGPNLAACELLHVSRYPPQADRVDPQVVWEPRFRWEADTEALFSAFVERLFDFPIEEELTWPNLSVLLQDRERNLLFNHFGQMEEDRIPLRPDCADLPYFLRTYFAWKMRLPFAFRSCTRGRGGNLPVCEELRTPIWEHGRNDPVDAFREFILTQVKRGVHSASGRTHPEDSTTPLYPVPMTREALRPGTVYADPYGHLLVVARWIPQGVDGYGILVGADAQPDGTVGRRRFWRGSFLFDADTTRAGAGFKAWRPIVYERREHTYRSLDNAEITAAAGYVPFSMQQYQGTTDAFYDTMEGLINPRALDPIQVQLSLIDALEESIARRIVSVNNGEDWVARNPGRTMEMPEDGAIFQTAGAWEDFATPSRDMRLLIAIDTVVGFPDAMRRNPARFGLSESDLDAAIDRVRARQREELARRSFSYTRSDGAAQPFTLADVVARSAGFEMSYNPNDCVEIRWGAPDGSPEMGSCRRHAPSEQRSRMRSYRDWFHTRRRPVW
ncbi:MAG: C40 family peptidase [Sandaracinaceae bacterium]|nr:C40 family peptidase [Sandaracinaceae bacterium]